MKIVTLLENTACCEDVTPQHGLSLYIETGGVKLLFDMGQDDVFVKNARAMGIDLSCVDLAVLSHGHYDHGGGLAAFLEVNAKAPVYLHRTAFGPYYNGTEKYIGLDTALQDKKRLIFTEGTVQLQPGMALADCNDLDWQYNPWGLNQKEENGFRPDDFRHEQYLQITEGEKRILISGCSHKGILNIAGHFRPNVLIGGFHLNKQEDPAELEETARQLLLGTTVYYTGHCTGERQFQIMKTIMGERLQKMPAGTVIEV